MGEQNDLEDSRLLDLSILKYGTSIPRVRNYFMDVKGLICSSIMESSENVKKIKNRYLSEMKCRGEYLNNDARALADCFEFHRGNDKKIYIRFKKELLDLSIRILIPRGNTVVLFTPRMDKDTSILVADFFNIYGTEGFSIAIETNGIAIAFVCQQGETKGSGVLNIYQRHNTAEYSYCRDWNESREEIALTFYRG